MVKQWHDCFDFCLCRFWAQQIRFSYMFFTRNLSFFLSYYDCLFYFVLLLFFHIPHENTHMILLSRAWQFSWLSFNLISNKKSLLNIITHIVLNNSPAKHCKKPSFFISIFVFFSSKNILHHTFHILWYKNKHFLQQNDILRDLFSESIS